MAKKPVDRTLPEYDNEDATESAAWSSPGRKPKKPSNRVSIPIRCLTTVGIWELVKKGAEIHGLSLSDYLRLALYRALVDDELLTEEKDLKDPTWDVLRLNDQV